MQSKICYILYSTRNHALYLQKGKHMSANTTIQSPYDFGRAIFLPFHSGSGSLIFVVKSAVFYAVGLFILYMLFGQMMQDASVVYQEKTIEDPLYVFTGMGIMLLKSLPIYLGMWMIWIAVETAFHRRVLFGDQGNPFPWRFGGDELRVMLCQLVVWIVFIVVLIVVYFVFALIAGLLSAVISSPIFMIVVISLGLLAALFVASFIAIRLSPAAARSVAEKRIAIGSVWAVTKGRFWPSLGAYYLLWIVGMIVYGVLMTVAMLAIYGADSGGLFMSSMSGDPAASLEMTKELYQVEGANLRSAILASVLGIYLAVLSLCIVGVSAHLNNLYDKAQGMLGADVFD